MADRPPVIAAWGAGVDSTAMIVELAERGEPVDMVLFADPGAEKSATYTFIPVFRAWMSERGIPSEIVRYQPRNFNTGRPTLPITERKSRLRRKMSSAPAAPLVDASHTTDGWKSLCTEHPTYVSACR